MTDYKCGDDIQILNYSGWHDATFIGIDPMNPDIHAVVLKDKLMWAARDTVRRKIPKPQSFCIMVYRDPQSVHPEDVHMLHVDNDGTARVYAFDRQLDVIKYITVEIPE